MSLTFLCLWQIVIAVPLKKMQVTGLSANSLHPQSECCLLNKTKSKRRCVSLVYKLAIVEKEILIGKQFKEKGSLRLRVQTYV